MKYDLIIFDLDGTLLDTSPGIFGSVRYAELGMGFKPISDCKLFKFLGPPPKEMYSKLYNVTEQDALSATRLHREYGMKNAIYEVNKYEGMESVLNELFINGCILAVATLKKQSVADKILEIHEMDSFFDITVGMDETEKMTKSDAIIRILENYKNKSAVMIGDSEYDYIGAKLTGTDFIGVTYGFGFSKDKSYPFRTARDPREILRWIK